MSVETLIARRLTHFHCTEIIGYRNSFHIYSCFCVVFCDIAKVESKKFLSCLNWKILILFLIIKKKHVPCFSSDKTIKQNFECGVAILILLIVKPQIFECAKWCDKTIIWILKSNPAVNYIFKFNNKNTRTRCEICSKLTIKTPEWRLVLLWSLYC